MFKNYFKIAWRNLRKHKVFSLINILGMSAAMAICILMLSKIKSIYDYDNFHPNAANTYRIITNLERKKGEHLFVASSPLALGPYLQNNYPQLQKFTRVCFKETIVKADDKSFPARTAFVDPDFYKIFGFKISSGAPALNSQTIVVSQDLATRFFGKDDPIGKTITTPDYGPFVISGILEKNKYPSHLKFDMIAPISLYNSQIPIDNWPDEAAGYTYIQVKKEVSKKSINSFLTGLNNLVNKIFLKGYDKQMMFEAQPLKSITPAMHPIYNTADEPPFSVIIFLATLGAIILLLSFFNYINLMLARSLDRAREVGVRKVVGALKSNLMHQFLVESVLLTLIAFVLALVEYNFLKPLPALEGLTRDVVQDSTLWIYFIAFALLTGLTAGWIPAKVLSRFKPVDVLKGKLHVRLFGGMGLRRALTVAQFAASFIALVTLVIFFKQSNFMATAEYGFARERIINLRLQGYDYNLLSSSMLSVQGVQGVSGSSGLFGFSEDDRKFIKQRPGDDSIAASYFSVSPSFITTMQLKFIAGKNLPEHFRNTDNGFIVLNETACRLMKFKYPVESIGQLIYLNDSLQYQVAGIVKGFHFQNFQHAIAPLVLVNNPNEFKTLALKINPGADQSVLSRIEKRWKALNPHAPISVHWYESDLYNQHSHTDDIIFIGLLTGIALLIACLGLLGMVIYTTKNRQKEIGIRKVLGADFGQLIYIISKEFIGLLLISITIGLPIGILFGKRFLQQYAYQIPISFFLLSGCAIAMLLIGFLTIGWQTYKAAFANPVESLRRE